MVKAKSTKTTKSTAEETAKEKKKAQIKPAKKAEVLEKAKAEKPITEIAEEKQETIESKITPLYEGGEEAVSIKGKSEEKPEKIVIEKYYEAVGRRKESVARVRLYTRKSTDVQALEDKALITVEGKPYYEYFRDLRLQRIVEAPLRKQSLSPFS